MKTSKFLLAVGLTVGFCMSLSAQIMVQSDGGVKIGTKPSGANILVPKWILTNKGLEVSIGDILFHTQQGGTFRITGEKTTIYGSKGKTAGSIIPVTEGPTSILSGSYLSLGTEDNYAHNVYVTNLTYIHQNTPSDIRYKENVSNIPDVREKVMQLRPVFYDLKTPADYIDDTMRLKNRVGFIAQEVEPLFPELVGYIPERDMYTLDYTSFIPYLTRVIQTQENTIAEQEERIAALERIVSDLIDQQQSGKFPNKAPSSKNRVSA